MAESIGTILSAQEIGGRGGGSMYVGRRLVSLSVIVLVKYLGTLFGMHFGSWNLCKCGPTDPGGEAVLYHLFGMPGQNL